MKFDGKNVGGDVIELFEGTVQEQIEKALNAKACGALGDLVPNLLASVLAELNAEVEPWMRFMDLPPARDGMARATAEHDRGGSATPSYSFRRTVMQLFAMAAAKLNSPTTPNADPTGTPGALGLGCQRCDYLYLDQTGNFEIDDFFGLFGFNSTIRSGDEQFSETIEIKSLKLAGLTRSRSSIFCSCSGTTP